MPEDALPAAGAIVRTLGRTAYEPTWRGMQAFTSARTPVTSDEIWITEHDPVYTLGLAGRMQHVRRPNGIPVLKVDRGGQVTFHGPGQVVLYLMFDLRRLALGVRAMVRAIEAAVIDWLASYAIEAYGKESAPGVYVRRGEGEAKIGALGLRVRNGCTYHGVAVNIAMDLGPFRDIDPCGYAGLQVTHVADFALAPAVADAGVVLAPLLDANIRRAAR